MIEQTAQVIAYSADTVSLSVENTSSCHTCQMQGGCGTGLLAKLFPRRLPHHLQLPRHWFPDNVQIADKVLLGVSEQALQTAVWLVYMLPLLGLILGGLLGVVLAEIMVLSTPTELPSILLGLLGLMLGSLSVRQHQSIKNLSFEQLKVLRIDKGIKYVSEIT